jgi:hypothetical protein
VKGLALTKIAGLALAVGTGTIVLGAVTGTLQPAMEDVFSDIVPEENQGVGIEVDDHYDLAGAAKLTMDRATECDIVAEHTYQDLAGTEVGRKPECSRSVLPAPPATDRAGEIGEGDIGGVIGGPGGDVEGVDGKLTFNITKSGGIVLRSRDVQEQGLQELGAELYSEEVDGYGTPVDDNAGGDNTKEGPLKLAGVSTQPYGNIVRSSCDAEFTSPSSGLAPDYEFIVTFENPPSGVDSRIRTGEDAFDLAQSSSNGVFCKNGGAAAGQIQDEFSEVKLCKGDQGYIQVNKGEPTGDAQTEDPEGSKTFAYIQITDAVENCNIDRNIEPFSSQVDNGGKTSGDTLRLELNEDDYPGMSEDDTKEYRAFDLVESGNADNIPRFSYSGEVPDYECMISLRERQPRAANPLVSAHEGWIDFPQGTKIPSVGGFPSQSKATRTSTGNGDFVPFFSDSRVKPLYTKLRNDGLTKASIGRFAGTGDLLVRTDQTDKFEMYGPLACGKQGGEEEARWHLCITKGPDAAGTRGKGLNTDTDLETELRCTESGWESQNSRNAGQETPDALYPSFAPDPPVFYAEDDRARFRPAQSAEKSDYVVWEGDWIPHGAKEFRITMSFEERGHLQIDLQRDVTGFKDRESETTTYINTDAYGKEHVYAKIPSAQDDYDNTGVDYPVNEKFTLVAERSGGETSWKLETEGDTKDLGSTVGPDFSRIVLESHADSRDTGEDYTAPKVDIHSFSVTRTE